MATLGTVGATGIADIDGLLSGDKWVGALTYSFPDASSDYIFGYGYGEPASGFAQISAAQQQTVHAILAIVESYTNLDISFAGTNGADIRVAQSTEANPTAFGYFPGTEEGGDVWFGVTENFRSPLLGDYAYATHIHELGHALGLKHSHEFDGVSGTALPTAHDSHEYTIMSYRAYAGAPLTGYSNEAFGYPTTFMRNDIRALQEMYGADFTTNSSDTVYAWSPATGEFSIDGIGKGRPGGSGAGPAANVVFMTIWDGGGVDTYDLSNYTTGVSINLNPGAASTLSAIQLADLGDGHIASGSVYNAYLYNSDARSYIENATGGSGSDTLIGNAICNTLDGGAGADVLTGGAGSDLFVFSADYGSDTITDFSLTGGDVINLDDLVGVTTLQDIVAVGSQIGANTILTFSIGLSLTLQNVSLVALTPDDFVFSGSGSTGGTGTTGGTGGTGSTSGANVAPYSIVLSKSFVTENVAGGSIGYLSVADANGDQTFTFAVSDERFTVAGTAGAYQLVLKTGQALDYETEASVALTLTATDAGGLSISQSLTIVVLNAPGATIAGTIGNDIINGTQSVVGQAKTTPEADRVFGQAGNDVIYGLGANDELNGGLGNDILDGGAGDDLLQGAAGADALEGGADGIAGDTASYAASSLGVTVDLGLGGAAQVSAGDAGGDSLSGIENLTGSAKADWLTGDDADNVIEGSLGNDVLDGGANATAGDTLSYKSANAGVKVSLAIAGAQNTIGAGYDTIIGFENVIGTRFADTIEGDGAANRLDGAAGIDTLSYASDTAGVTVRLDGSVTAGGNAAGDQISAFENLTGGSGNDTLGGTGGANTIDGGAGNDTLAGFGGTDIIKGGFGTDTVDFLSYATAGVKVSLAISTSQITGVGTVTLSGIEKISGSDCADILTGDRFANSLFGNAGDDLLQGGVGADLLDGGANGIEGDTASYAASLLGVKVNLGLGISAQISAGDAAGDVLSGIENLLGSAKADWLTGDDADNIMEGGLGNDLLDGGLGADTASYARSTTGVKASLSNTGAQNTAGAGVDTLVGFENLRGSKFSDTLVGSDGDNILVGGLGLDILTGGYGSDTFDFAALADKGDRITDFQSGTDILQLHAAGFAGAQAGSVNFASGSTPLSGDGHGWLLYDTDDGRLYYDADGSGLGARQLLAVFDVLPGLVATDIVII